MNLNPTVFGTRRTRLSIEYAKSSKDPSILQPWSSSPVLSPTVTFRLKLTPELEKIAEKVDKTADGTQEYVFFVGINSYTKSKTDNCLTLVVYQEDGDESVYYIELKDGAKEALYERLDEQCRKKLGKSCEKLLKEAKKKIDMQEC